MEILLEELYKTDIHIDKYHDRKIYLEDKSYQIIGITQSGKTKLVKQYLLQKRKNSYLFIDCSDTRIDIDEFNKLLPEFCLKNSITTVVFDNYTIDFNFVNVEQLIITSEIDYNIEFLTKIRLYPLDYEEFLAYEHRFDSSTITHFFQLGGLAHMHKINADSRHLYIQKILKASLSSIEFDILKLVAKMNSQKLSAFAIYERLKLTQKISKDKLYKAFESLVSKNYIHQLSKFNHKKATKKVYLCDIALKGALSVDKHFGRLFENMIFLELLKSSTLCYYDDGVDFYLPDTNEIILAMPFADERTLFKKLELIEAFIFSYQIDKITVVTMSKEGSLSHPISKVELLPFDIWALGD